MRKITESTLVSLDGVFGDPQLWAMQYFDDDAQQDALKRLLISDAMLMGRYTYEALSRVWPTRAGAFADRINAIKKYVFSSTLTAADWNNTEIVRGDVATEVFKIKQQDGQDLTIYGHGRLSETLMREGLIDEFRFSIHPIFVGSGKLLLREDEKHKLTLASGTTLATGVVVVIYRKQPN
jgi:dihydrofolate reductase